MATLPGTPALRREQIKLQVALITPLIHVKGYAAAETKAAAEQARLLIEQAEALGEPPEDPLLLFNVLAAFWAANFVAFNGDVVCDLATQLLALAEKQRATVPLMIGHRLMGQSLLLAGDIAEGRAHLDQAIALYEPAEHRPLATRFGQDVGVVALSFRSFALWLLGYPEAALRDTDDALMNAREMGQAATLMYALAHAAIPYTLCGNRAAAAARRPRTCRSGRRKRRPILEGVRNDEPRLRIGSGRQGVGRDRNADLRDFCLADNGSDRLAAALFAALGSRPCGAWTIRGGLALHRRSDDSGGDNQGKVLRGRSSQDSGGHRIDVTRSRTRRKPKRISSTPWQLRASDRQSPGSCALRRAWRGYGAIRVSGTRRATYSLRSTAGSPKASLRAT